MSSSSRMMSSSSFLTKRPCTVRRQLTHTSKKVSSSNHLDSQPTVREVLAHVILDLLGPHAPVALLEELLDAQSPLLRRVGPDKPHSPAAQSSAQSAAGAASNRCQLVLAAAGAPRLLVAVRVPGPEQPSV